jgi:hypothetical protein
LNRNQLDARGDDLFFCQFDNVLLLIGRFRGRLSLLALLAVSPRDCVAPGSDINPTALRTDCENPGIRLATATPATRATIKSDKRPIIPQHSQSWPRHRPLIRRARFTLTQAIKDISKWP